MTEAEAYRIAAGALRRIPAGYAAEGQRCADSIVAALLHFTARAHAEGLEAGLRQAARFCDQRLGENFGDRIRSLIPAAPEVIK